MIQHTVSSPSNLTHGPNTVIGFTKVEESQLKEDIKCKESSKPSTVMSTKDKRTIVLRKTSIDATSNPLRKLGGSMRNVVNREIKFQVPRSPSRGVQRANVMMEEIISRQTSS